MESLEVVNPAAHRWLTGKEKYFRQEINDAKCESLASLAARGAAAIHRARIGVERGRMMKVVKSVYEVGLTVTRIELEKELARNEATREAAANGRRPNIFGLKQLDEGQKSEALALIEKYQTPGVSKTKACTRAARDLKKRHKAAIPTGALLNLMRKR